ncbi:MAG: hypothetical protein IJ689_04980 [Alphaproteobacteria bacterium]|nr:hypothetical protein [Alphaproteobacteria bacterium]
MNKYILMLGIAAVSIGSCAACAGNTATMQVTATIAHDVSLTINEGIAADLIINPSQTSGSIHPSLGGSPDVSGGIMAGSSVASGDFRANVPDLLNTGYFTFAFQNRGLFTLSNANIWVDESEPGRYYMFCDIAYSDGVPAEGENTNIGSIVITYNAS